MADMNLFSGFQSALSGAGSGLISASKEVESYIQNIYQDAADDISERKKLFKNLVEKIGIAEDKGIKNILDRYEEFEKEAIALSSKEENRNQKKYSETLQQISLIQGTVQKALNKAFKDASETTRSLIDQIHKSSAFQVEDILKQAKTFGVSDANLKKIEETAKKEIEKNQQKAFRETAKVFRKITGQQFEAILKTGAEGVIKSALDAISVKYGFSEGDLLKMVAPAFQRATKIAGNGKLKAIDPSGITGSFGKLTSQRISAIYSGYSKDSAKALRELIGAQEEIFDFGNEIAKLSDIAKTVGKKIAVNIDEATKELQIGFYDAKNVPQKLKDGAWDMSKMPSFKFSAQRLKEGLLSRSGMTTPNDLVMKFDKDTQKTVVTTTANLIMDGVADVLRSASGVSDKDLMYRLRKAVDRGYRGASSESTKFFDKEINDLRDGISSGRIMNMGGRINVVPAFSDILKAIKKANIDVGTTSEHYDEKVFRDLFSVIDAWRVAGRSIEKLKSDATYGYLFKDNGIANMIKMVIDPISRLPLAIGQGSTAQINNGYIQLAANWQRAASFLPGDTSKHLSQTQNYEIPRGGTRSSLPSTKIRTAAGQSLGFNYDALSERLYNIQYITEEKLLEEWDKWLESESGKEYLGQGGSKILPGLHDSASIYRSDLINDFITQRYRYKRVSANDWYETQRKLGLSGKLSGLSEDQIAATIVSNIMGVDIKNIEDLKWGQMSGDDGSVDPTKDFVFNFNEIVDWMGNPKGLGAETGTRSAMMPIVSKFITERFGQNIHMLRLAEEMGSNDFGGMIIGAIQHVLVNGKSAKDVVTALKGTSLDGIFEADGDNLILSSTMDKTRTLDLNKVQKELESSLGIQFKEGLVISEAVNASHDYFYQKDTKYGQRELEAMRRTISTASSINKDIDFTEFLSHEESTVVSKGAEDAKKMRDSYAKAFRASFGSNELQDEVKDITEEFLGKDTTFAFNQESDLGLVDAESFANSALANIYEQISQSGAGFGRISLPKGFKPIKHTDGFGQEWSMSSIVVPAREHEAETAFFDAAHQTGISLSEFDISLNRVIRSIAEYNDIMGDSKKSEEDREYITNKLNRDLENFYRDNYAYFTSKDSPIAQDIYYNRVRGSHSFMAAGLSEAQRDKLLKSSNPDEKKRQDEKELGKILDESYLVGPEAMRKLIGDDIKDIKTQYEYVFGEKASKKMSKDEMLDKIIEAMTVENIGTDVFKKRGLFSKDLRFPSIQGQDVRYIRGFVTNELRGSLDTAYMGSAAAAANRTDYDRDHVNLLSAIRNIGGVKNVEEYLKAAEAVTRLHEAVSANIRDVRAANKGKISGKVELFKDVNVTDEDLSRIASVAALRNRGQIGLLSSQATEMRNFLSSKGFDEMQSGDAPAGLGQLVRYAFEKAEQDAISYKHVIKRLSSEKFKSSGITAEAAMAEDRKKYIEELGGDVVVSELLKRREELEKQYKDKGGMPLPSELINDFDVKAAWLDLNRLKYGRDTRVLSASDEDVMRAKLAATTSLEQAVAKAWERDGAGYKKTSDYFRALKDLGIFGDQIEGVPFIQALTQATASGGEDFEKRIRNIVNTKKYNVDVDALLMKRDASGNFVSTNGLAQMPFEMLMDIIDMVEAPFATKGKTLLSQALISANRTLGDESQSDYAIGKFLKAGNIEGKTPQKIVKSDVREKVDNAKKRAIEGKTGKSNVDKYLTALALSGASDDELITAAENVQTAEQARSLMPQVQKEISRKASDVRAGGDLSKVNPAVLANMEDWTLFKAKLNDPGHTYSKVLADGKEDALGRIKSASQMGSFFRGGEYTDAMRAQDEAFERALEGYGKSNFSIGDFIGENYTSQDIKIFENLRRKKIASDFGTIQHKEIEILGKLLANPPKGLDVDALLSYSSGTSFEGKIRSALSGDSVLKKGFEEDLKELEEERSRVEKNLGKFGYNSEDIQKFQNAALFSTLAQTQLTRKLGLKNVAREYSLGLERGNLLGGKDYTAGTIDQIYYKDGKFVIGDSKNKSGADPLSQVLQITYGAMALKKLIQEYGNAKDVGDDELDKFKKQYGIEDNAEFTSAIEEVLQKGDLDNAISGIITKFDTRGGYVKAYQTDPLKDAKMADLLDRYSRDASAMTPEERAQIEKYQAELYSKESRIFADNPSELSIFKYDELIDKSFKEFANAIQKRAELQKRLFKLEQEGQRGSLEYESAQKEIDKLNAGILAKEGERFVGIGGSYQKEAADLADTYKESVEAYEADYAYNEVVKGISEERKLQSEIFKLNKQKSDLKKEDAKANEATIKEIEEVLKSYQQSIDSIKSYREQLKELYGDKWNEDAGDGKPTKFEDIKTREKLTELLGARDKKRLADAETNSATKEYVALLNQQLQLELKIKGFQRDAATSRGRQKELDLIAAEKYNEQLEETNKNLEKIDKSKVKNIDSINAEHELKRNSALASLYAKKPYSNIFEYIKADIGRATQRIVDFGLAARVLNTARKEIQQVYQNILKLDEAMTNLRIVTGSNTEQAKSMMNTYNDLAMQLGTTTQAVAQSAAEWLRQGYSVSEANELIKSSTYLSRLGFMDMGQSVTALTSVMKGFRIEATNSMDIVDKLTQLDAKYATTAGDIATALSRTSAVAREAGLSLDQTAAALTTMIDVSQQDASSVGNAFRTILARYGNVKATAFTSLVGDSEDIDDANGSINDTEKVLGAIGIKIRSSSSDMRDFDDVMDELADKWVTLTDVEKNAVSTALAGVRQRNIFGIYMENYDTYKQAISEAEKAEGTAARKMQAYNESVAYSINQLSAAWEGFTQKLEASGAVKFFFNSLTAIIENLDHILQYLMPVIATFNADKIVSLAKFLSPLITVPFKAIRHPIDTVKKSHGAFYENMAQKMTAENTNAIEELTNATKDNTAALRGEKSKSDKTGVGKADEGAAKKGPETGVVTTKQKPYQKYSSDVRSRIDSLNYHISEAEKQGNVSAVEKLKKIKSEELRKIEGNKSEIISAYRKNTRDAKELAQKQIDEIDKRTQASKANALMRKEIAENAHKNGQVQSKLKEKDRRAAASQIRAAEVEASGEQQKKQILKERNDRLKEIKKRTKKDLREENKRLKQQEKEYNRANSTGRVKTKTDVKEPTPEERANLEAQKKLERSARLKTGVVSGIGAGAVRFANKGSSFLDEAMGVSGVEVDTGEALAMGVAQGALTGVATAFMGPAGAVLASIVGDALSSLWKKLAHADEIDRKQRVEDAKKQLEAIKGISTAVTGLIDLRKKGDTSLWDADDWKQANEYVESLEKARNSSVGFKDALNDAIEGLGNYTLTIEKLTENQETLAKVEAARIKYEAEQTYAAGAQDRYTLLKEIEDAQKKLTSNNEDERKQAQATIKANRAAIQEYTDELNKAYMKSAFYSSGVSTMSQAQKNTASLERLIVEMAEEAEKAAEGKTDEKFFEDDGTLKSEYRSKFIQQLREQGGYEAVLTESEKSVADYKKAMGTVAKLTDKDGKKLSMTLSDLKKLVSSKGGMAKLEYLLGKTGDEFDRIVDQINSADDGKIATIAHSLNMTVEEFEKANKNGDFNFFTTGMAVENLDAFIDRIDKLNGYLAELATNGKLSAESLENVAKNYAFLMQSQTERGSFGTQNILENLANLYAEGSDSTIAKALAGKFQREAATSETWWSAWKESDIGREFVESNPLFTTFKSFSDAMSSMNEDQKKAYIDYVSSLYNTDLYEEVQEKLVEWQTKAYENEISNLESIRDSLDDVNKQREKELELIKAKEALENASKEKKRVYRAGVGFVYTTDQEAVKSAQEKVDELERQRDKDDIQYQIDSLQQQKEILENLKNNEQLEHLTKFVEKIQEAIGTGDGKTGLFASILTKDGDFQKNMQSTIAQDISQSATLVKDQENLEATKTYAKEFNEAGMALNDFVNKNSAILNDPNNPAYEKTYNEYQEKLAKLSDARSKYVGASETRPLTSEEMKSYGFSPSRFSFWENMPSSAKKGTPTNTMLQDAGLNLSTSNNEADEKLASSLISTSKDELQARYLLYHYEPMNGWTEKAISNRIPYKDIVQNMSTYDVLVLDRGGFLRDYAVFKDENGKIRWASSDGKIKVGGTEKLHATEEKACGDLSFSGGRALINENGLESIITPQGTITSLPAKTGIVPADLTRNLWALGEVAPNLIARLGGNSLQTNNSNSSTDNSINIQNLDATFYTEEGFDGEAFLRDLKSQVILTSNNH